MTTGAMTELQVAWERQLEGLSGSFGLVLRTAEGPVLARDPDRRHYAASTIKLAALAAWLYARASGLPAADGRVTVHSRFASAAGGYFDLHRGDDQDDQTWDRLATEVDLGDLAERMVTASGNLAADLVLERLGLDGVRAFLDKAGTDDAIVAGRLIGDSAAEAAGLTNSVTAAGLALLMAGIADHSLLGTGASTVALDLLERQSHRRMIPAGLPQGTWSASKGGWVTGVKHDVALVRPRTAPPYVLAICTTTELDDPEGEALVAGLSALTWEHWNTWHE